MKKILSIMLILAMVLGLAACGSSSGEPATEAAAEAAVTEDDGEAATDIVDSKMSDSETSKDENNDATIGENTTEAITFDSNVQVGDYITFGTYEQDNDLTNGAEPIEWRVLATDSDYSLIISKYGLDAKAYDTDDSLVTWETCTLRSWLNGYDASSNADGEDYTSYSFISTAFNATEQAAIRITTVQNPDSYFGRDSDENYIVNNTGTGIEKNLEQMSGGNTTYDKVFLLSLDEAQTYFDCTEQSLTKSNGTHYYGYPDLQTSATAYAVAQGASKDNDYNITAAGDECCWWWLRSLGKGRYTASCVNHYGVCEGDISVKNVYIAVRPALWVETSYLKQ